MLIPLICKQCGGRLDVEQSQVINSGDTVIVLSGQTLKCPHCGVQYLSGEKIRHVPSVSVGSISVGGNMSGRIIVGNGMVVNETLQQTNPSETHSSQQSQSNNPPEAKTLKKWWEFWKK